MIRRNLAMPRARKDDLDSTEISGEKLVYDLKTHRVFRLNKTAALVWRYCDGKTRGSEVLAKMRRELGIEPDARLIQLALNQLDEAGLLSPEASLPVRKYSRRELARTLSLSLALFPVVVAALAPTPASAASCTGAGGGCGGGQDCCPGLECNNNVCG
jgi:hypothetical protein